MLVAVTKRARVPIHQDSVAGAAGATVEGGVLPVALDWVLASDLRVRSSHEQHPSIGAVADMATYD